MIHMISHHNSLLSIVFFGGFLMETNIPGRLKQLRETANLTQSDMAEILDVKLQSYQRFR